MIVDRLPSAVMPTQAGIQPLGGLPRLDFRFRGKDSLEWIQPRTVMP